MSGIVQIGDYVVANVDGHSKPKLLLVRKVSQKILGVVPDDKMNTPAEESHKIGSSDIISLLGNSPKNGSVYGVKVEPVLEVRMVKKLGQVIVKHPDSHLVDRFCKSIRRWYTKLLAKGVVNSNIQFEIAPKKSRYAGTYYYKPNEDNDRIVFHTDEISGISRLVLHELGHGTWFRLLQDKTKSKWIKLYEQYVQTQIAEKDTVKSVLEAMAELSDMNVSGYLDTLEKDGLEEQVADSVLQHIQDVYGLKISHLDMLLDSGLSIKDYLPSSSKMVFGESKSPVTEYANKSPEELWAEVFALYHLKADLPLECRKLMRRSIKNLRV